MLETYKTICLPTENILFKEKASKFIGYAFPITDEQEVKSILENLKKEHHKARHVCYAYRLGNNGETYRANDDGEPNNTAGIPIYAVNSVDRAGASHKRTGPVFDTGKNRGDQTHPVYLQKAASFASSNTFFGLFSILIFGIFAPHFIKTRFIFGGFSKLDLFHIIFTQLKLAALGILTKNSQGVA